jgi:KDO2-lipid IV(A) lauroyltransferase
LVVLSGHYGNWELIAFGMAYLAKIPFTIIVQKQNNIFVDAIINKHRCWFGNRVVPMGLSVREIIKTLHDGGIVAIAPDQSGDKDHGIYIEFFGSVVATHQGPAVFALRSGAPLLMGFMLRQPDGTYEVILEEIPTKDLIGHSDENIRELTRRHLRKLEQHIRQHPDHWLWMHRRWKHTLKHIENQSTQP